MAKPAIANTNIATETFGQWLIKTNEIVTSLRTEIVTANSEANGSLTTGNAFVIGILGANTVVVPTALRGGNVQSSNTLNITSNVVVSNTFTINTSAGSINLLANTRIEAANAYVNATNITLTGNTLSISSNTTNITANTITLDGVNINSNVIFRTDLQQFVVANTDLGSNISSAQEVFSFAKSSFSSGKITAQNKKGTNTNITEILIAHDTTSNVAQLTVYGSIKAPLAANLGVYTATTNATHVVLNYLQTNTSSSVKLVANLIK